MNRHRGTPMYTDGSMAGDGIDIESEEYEKFTEIMEKVKGVKFNIKIGTGGKIEHIKMPKHLIVDD